MQVLSPIIELGVVQDLAQRSRQDLAQRSRERPPIPLCPPSRIVRVWGFGGEGELRGF